MNPKHDPNAPDFNLLEDFKACMKQCSRYVAAGDIHRVYQDLCTIALAHKTDQKLNYTIDDTIDKIMATYTDWLRLDPLPTLSIEDVKAAMAKIDIEAGNTDMDYVGPGCQHMMGVVMEEISTFNRCFEIRRSHLDSPTPEEDLLYRNNAVPAHLRKMPLTRYPNYDEELVHKPPYLIIYNLQNVKSVINFLTHPDSGDWCMSNEMIMVDELTECVCLNAKEHFGATYCPTASHTVMVPPDTKVQKLKEALKCCADAYDFRRIGKRQLQVSFVDPTDATLFATAIA